MDDRVGKLASIIEKTGGVIAAVPEERLDAPTPCSAYSVRQLLSHVAVWIQVFDGAVNGEAVAFDPMTHIVDGGWHVIFEDAGASLIAGLREGGVDREMTLTSSSLSGEFVLNMMLMEYVGHGWDLARATQQTVPFSDHEADGALEAAQALLQPQYRGTGMFGEEVAVGEDQSSLDRYVGFIGRDPVWAPG